VAVDYENLTDEDYFACLKLMFKTDGWEVLMTSNYVKTLMSFGSSRDNLTSWANC